ncbi:alpha/beta fold hydrolase [Candidatus Woesearchaeota archaeon]|nr:alpha/beta fold hydrolase [Candidatus Woesearchaeota archaeon]
MKKIISIMALAVLMLVLVGCSYEPAVKTSAQNYKPSPNPREESKAEAVSSAEQYWKFVSLKTDDDKEIFGKYYKADDNVTGYDSNVIVILLHMLDKDHSSWDKFAEQLYDLGYSVIAIDLRGHGKSAESTGSWQDFSEKDFNDMTLDVKEAKEFGLHEKKTRFVIIGASIGANTALNYAAKDKEILGVALLSPGMDYRGLEIENTALSYGQRPILLAASEEDTYSADAVKELNSKIFGKKKIVMFKDAGHGTDMFKGTELDKELLNWLKEVIT